MCAKSCLNMVKDFPNARVRIKVDTQTHYDVSAVADH